MRYVTLTFVTESEAKATQLQRFLNLPYQR